MTDTWQWHDFHVHTRPHSPDAHWRATLSAMLKRAAKNGIKVVGLSNHYFPTTKFNTFSKLRDQVARKAPNGMTVYIGAELCILDTHGNLILTKDEAAQLDYILAGPHHFKQRWVEQPPTGDATAFIQHQHQMMLNAVQNPLVNGLAHPWVINVHRGQKRWGFDIDAFVAAWHDDYFIELGEAAVAHKTAIEVGMGIHLMAEHQGQKFWQRYVQGMQILRHTGAKFYFGSDAHHLHVIARLDWLKISLGQLGFSPSDIITPSMWIQR